MNIKKFKKIFSEIEEAVDKDNLNELEEKVYKLEEKINDEIGFGTPSEENALQNLLNKITRLKKENDFYDASAELDRMFPNRNDDDFDEDSMTFDSIFGDD